MSNGPKTKSFLKTIFCLSFRELKQKKSFLLWREQRCLLTPPPSHSHQYNQTSYLSVSLPFWFSACFSAFRSIPLFVVRWSATKLNASNFNLKFHTYFACLQIAPSCLKGPHHNTFFRTKIQQHPEGYPP